MKIEYILTKGSDDFCKTEEQFIHMLQSNSRIRFQDLDAYVSQYKYSYELSSQEVEWGKHKDQVFILVIKTPSNNENDAVMIETFDSLFRRIIKECSSKFVIYTVWDDASLYYARRLYPQIANIESLLRSIIYRFMINNAGCSWFEDTVPNVVRKSIKESLKKDKKRLDDDDTDPLYYADFIQLSEFFTHSYPIKEFSNNAIKRIRNLVEQGSDANVILDALSDYEYKSNWDRYFANEIKVENLAEKWEELYYYRNIVAHTKRLRFNDYKAATKLIDEMKLAFEACLDHISSITVSEDESAAVAERARESVGFYNNEFDSLYTFFRLLNTKSNEGNNYMKFIDIMSKGISELPDEGQLGKVWIEAEKNMKLWQKVISKLATNNSMSDDLSDVD